MDSRRQHRVTRSGLLVAGLAFAFMAFVLVTHLVNRSTREGILFFWLCASVPIAITFSVLGRIWSIASLLTIGTSLWFAVAYISDMGGDYAHDVLAAGNGFAGIFSLCLFGLVVFIRVWRDSDRKRLRRFMNPKRSI